MFDILDIWYVSDVFALTTGNYALVEGGMELKRICFLKQRKQKQKVIGEIQSLVTGV